MKKCPCCGQELPWPYVPLSPMQREIITEIKVAKLQDVVIKNCTELGRRLGRRGAMVRVQINRMNTKLSKKNLYISNKPVRLVLIKPVDISSIPDYLSTI